jgi:oligopeptide/dipeptide ABC transporter ATP-binding protein
MSELLRIQGLAVHYQPRRGLLGRRGGHEVGTARAVDGIDLRLRSGETLALVGESGSGKSTTARALLGVTPISAGEIYFEGTRVLGPNSGAPPSTYRRHVQMIYQDPYESLDPRRRVRAIVRAPLDIHRSDLPRHDREARTLDALERVGLTPATDYAARYAHQLSGGERQRVSIAAALILDPRVIIADEPVSMLDVSIRGRILDLLAELQKQMALGMILITHDLRVAARTADHIAVMYLGRIVECGPTDDVISRPAHPYTRALLSVVPQIGGDQGPPILLEGEVPDPARVPTGCRFHPRCPVAEHRCGGIDPQLLPTDHGAAHRAACVLVADPEGTKVGNARSSDPLPPGTP